jgi:hypothetical protein
MATFTVTFRVDGSGTIKYVTADVVSGSTSSSKTITVDSSCSYIKVTATASSGYTFDHFDNSTNGFGGSVYDNPFTTGSFGGLDFLILTAYFKKVEDDDGGDIFDAEIELTEYIPTSTPITHNLNDDDYCYSLPGYRDRYHSFYYTPVYSG